MGIGSKQFVSLACAAIVGALGVYWLKTSDEPTERSVKNDASPETEDVALGDAGSELAEAEARRELRPGAPDEAQEFEFGEAYPVAERKWSERFPEARVIESEASSDGDGRNVVRKWLLKTDSERLPNVIWEDIFKRKADGGLAFSHSNAFVADSFLVELDPADGEGKRLSAFLDEFGLGLGRVSKLAGFAALTVPQPRLGLLPELVDAYRSRFPGRMAERDALHFTASVPDDYNSGRMWGLDQVGATDAWRFEEGREDVVIAILDTGIDVDHPDLADNIFVNQKELLGEPNVDDDGNGLVDDIRGWDFFNNDAGPDDFDGHGTHVAGIAAAVGDNGQGNVGLAWRSKILPLRVGSGEGLSTSAIAESLAYISDLHDSGVNVVVSNNSYGSNSFSSFVRSEIEEHRARGILFVAAAGNDGVDIDSTPNYPAAYDVDNIISVANSNQEDTLTFSSSFGSVGVDLSAPGLDIYSTYRNGGYSLLSGTSMASPLVAGAVALVASKELLLSGAQIKQRILSTVEPVAAQNGLTATGGRLDVMAALNPSLKNHAIAVSNVLESIVLLDSEQATARFEIAALPGANVSARLIEGLDTGDLEAEGDRVFVFRPATMGAARIRFTAELGGVERTVDRHVFVGPVGDVQSGMTHRFEFEGNGTTVSNSAGGSNGALVGADRLSSDLGKAIRFDASSEKVSFDARLSEQVTIAALVRADDILSSPHPRIVNMPFYYLYFSSGQTSSAPDGNRETLKFFANYDQAIGVWNAPPRSAVEGEWLYVVGSYDSASIDNLPDLYVNGRQLPVREQAQALGNIVDDGGTSYLGNNDDDSRSWNGLMASVRIYDRTVDASEVNRIGAVLMESKWERYELVGPEMVAAGQEADFRIGDSASFANSDTVSWRVEGAAEIVPQSDGSVSFLAATPGVYRLWGRVADGLSSRVFTHSVTVTNLVTSGHYRANTAGGGSAWLEVGEDVSSGFLTIFDRESGFYRIREKVTIDANGGFVSDEDSVGRATGSVLDRLEGEVLGYGVSFSGEALVPVSDESPYAGIYRGGGIGVAGDFIELEILADGRLFWEREGGLADVAVGLMGDEGTFALESVSGAAISGVVDSDGGRVDGMVDEAPFHLWTDSASSGGTFKGGFVGGELSGAGVGGLYGSFVPVGESLNANLAAGSFSVGGNSAEAIGSLVTMGADGSSGARLLASGESLIEALARWIGEGLLKFASRELGSIQAQVPVAQDGKAFVGFAVEGEEPREVLIRLLGPAFSVAGASDPSLKLYRYEAGVFTELGESDDWRDGAVFNEVGESSQGAFRRVETLSEALGLPPLEEGDRDAALSIWLAEGIYLVTAENLEGQGGSTFLQVFAIP